MKKNWLSWLFWLPPFGILGMHKIYLDNPFMGLVYFFTGGGCIFGWIMDAFTMSRQVDEANDKLVTNVKTHLREELLSEIPRKQLEEQVIDTIVSEARGRGADPAAARYQKAILRLAYERGGKVTVGDVAVKIDITLDEAERILKEMSSKGYCGMNVTDSGRIEYEFDQLFSTEGT